MHRQGILSEEIDEAIVLLRNAAPNLVLEGISSHLPDADNIDTSFTQAQIKKWNSIVKRFRNDTNFPNFSYWHLSNTDGHAFSKDIEANVSRLGLGLYLGLGQISTAASVTPASALEMKTIISGIKYIRTGDKIGYSGTFTAPNDMTIATIPVGYFEGVDRRLSNTGFVKIESGETIYFPPIIGRVSMNITTIDITDIPGVNVGHHVVVVSANVKDKNSVRAVAELCDTIPYEILVHIPAHLKRIVK